MKLIVVDRTKMETYRKLTDKFADDLNVRVVWDRRKNQARTRQESHYPDRRQGDRRKLKKGWDGRDYFVIYVVEDRLEAASVR
jgi:5'-3' exonuclease